MISDNDTYAQDAKEGTNPNTAVSKLHYDLLVLIFQEFDLRLPVGRRDCAHCALVCGAWSEPASRVLWRILSYSSIPLCHILQPLPNPSEACNCPAKELTAYYNEIIESRPWTSSEVWGRFLHCSARVREVRTWKPNRSEVKLLHLLLDYNGGVTFLPSLSVLDWSDTPYTRKLICAIAPPSLKELHYDVEPGTDVSVEQVEETLKQMASKNPLLSSLQTMAFYKNTSLMRLISAFPSLRRLDVIPYRNLTSVDFEVLSALSTLEYLRCGVKDFAGCRDTFNAPRLLRLHVFGVTRTMLVGFLTHLNAHLLEALELEVIESHSEYTPARNRELLQEVEHSVFAKNLRSIKFYTREKTDYARTDIPFTTLIDVLRPLLSLSHLRRVDIRYRWISSLTDADVLAFAQAWPLVEELSIQNVNYAGPFPTPISFCHLARHCPRLTRLSFAARLNIDDQLVVPESTTGPSHPLRSLKFSIRHWDVEMIPAEEVARLLDRLFPNLVLSECNRNESPAMVRLHRPWETMWKQIQIRQKKRVSAAATRG